MKKTSILVMCVAAMLFAYALSPALSGSFAAEDITLTENKLGKHDGYDYELWKDSGTTSMTVKDGGAFSCSWSNINNALFRTGLKFDSTEKHAEIGEFTMDYQVDYRPNGNSYLSVYGWTQQPLVEYYIIESWGNWRPPGSNTVKTTITVNGGVYDVYETTRTQQPSIEGTATFQQYWSVRQSKRTQGIISISEHFRQWEKLGMEMGNFYEVSLVVEGYQSSGSADVLRNNITISDEIGDVGSASLTVVNCTYAGDVKAGERIILSPYGAPSGSEFDSWEVIVDTGETINIVNNEFIMPDANVTITATYRSITQDEEETESCNSSAVLSYIFALSLACVVTRFSRVF